MRYIFLLLFVVVLCSASYADEVYLKNGDRITGVITKRQGSRVFLDTKSMGLVVIDDASIERIDKEKPPGKQQKPPEEIIQESKEQIVWKKEANLGYSKATGNTTESQLSAGFFINRNNMHVDEITLKGNLYYSSTNRKMDSQKYYGMARYAYSFGNSKMWYNFYRLEADHDRFADIDYRLVPAAGIGYWFFDKSDFKLMAELGVGLEHTHYRSNTEEKNEGILIPRLFLEKRLFKNTKITQDVYYYPQWEDFNMYRIRSKTELDIALNKKLSARLSLIDDYNSSPTEGTKKNDLKLISSLAYSF
jgi:putative salt-induced outer membrane protein YdiY